MLRLPGPLQPKLHYYRLFVQQLWPNMTKCDRQTLVFVDIFVLRLLILKADSRA